jgi:nucleolar protein TMA23
MWWMNAFDKSLKGLDTTQEGRIVQSLTTGGLDMVAKGGSKFVGKAGLYASFVRGEGLSGTITPEEAVDSPTPKERRRVEAKGESKETRKARKADARNARARSLLVTEPLVTTPSSESVQINEGVEDGIFAEPETKAQRRERRKQKMLMRKAQEQSIKVLSTAKIKKQRKS